MGKLDNLNQQVRACRLCRLCRVRLNGVPGEGNESAEVLFIGEGPGFNEDREGRPFVGAAGQFLDELLAVAGLQRLAVYITNVVKCRPPQNRDPLPDEIDACAPYLERQIATIDPVLIVTLGRYSMARFFPNDKISSVHGQARHIEGRIVMTMWHPAFGLRSPEGRESITEDFAKLPAVLEQARAVRAGRPAPPRRVAPHLGTMVALDPPAPVLAPAPVAIAAAPTLAEPEDGFAYLAAVTGKTRKLATRRKTSAPVEAAAPVAPTSSEALVLIDEPEAPPYTTLPATAEPVVCAAPMADPAPEPLVVGAAESPNGGPGAAAASVAPASLPAAAGGVTPAGAAPAEPAPKSRKKEKPEREFKQLGLFE